MRKITALTTAALTAGLLAGCASAHQGSAPATHSAKPAATPTATHTAPPSVDPAAAMLYAKLKAHGVRCGKLTPAGIYADCGGNTVLLGATGYPGSDARHLLSVNGGAVVVGQTWVVSTTNKMAPAVQKALGGKIITRAAQRAAARAKAARKAARKAAANTVTYEVSGSPADVTYGPAGSDSQGSVPMRVDAPLGRSPAAYYALDAQLNGGGSVTVTILIGGKVISTASASGSYNIASAEVDQNPLTGQWEDTNGG